MYWKSTPTFSPSSSFHLYKKVFFVLSSFSFSSSILLIFLLLSIPNRKTLASRLFFAPLTQHLLFVSSSFSLFFISTMRTCFLEYQLIASTLSYQDKAWKLGEEYQYFWEKELEEVVLQKCRENFQKLPVLIGKWPFLTQKWFYFTKTWHFRKSTICLKLFFFSWFSRTICDSTMLFIDILKRIDEEELEFDWFQLSARFHFKRQITYFSQSNIWLPVSQALLLYFLETATLITEIDLKVSMKFYRWACVCFWQLVTISK